LFFRGFRGEDRPPQRFSSLLPSGLTDGVIQLRQLTQADAAAHLAGEDEEMAKWLSGRRSTAATQTAIDKFEKQWRTGGPRRAFGVFDCSNHQLIRFCSKRT
jgi:RimJ/RimL family protein N-acetyltransferase